MSPPRGFEQRPEHRDSARSEELTTPSPDAAAQLSLCLSAQWACPSIARDRVDRWLRAHHWPADSREDIVFVVSEAVTNSVEHGYRVDQDDVDHPGTIEVDCRIETAPTGAQFAELTIRDHGRWRPYSATEHSHRRRGIPIMRATMDQVSISGTSHGTTVVLRSPSLYRP